MMRLVATEINTYLEEMIRTLDFNGLNEFLNNHLRTKISFTELVELISINGLEAINRETITQLFFDTVFYELSIARPIFIKMLLFCVLFSVVHRLLAVKNSYISQISFLVIYATLMVLLMQSFFLVKDIALEGMESMLMFLNALIPTYAAALAFTGNSITGAFAYELGFILVYIVEFMIKNFITSLIHVFVLILFLNHLFDEDRISKLADFIEKIIGIALKASFGAVIGLGVVQSVLTPVKDRLASNVIISGMSSIPGVGGAIGSAGEIILSCGMLIKNSIGIIGLIILFLVSVIPVLKIGCFWVLYHLLSIVLQPITDKRITECIMGVTRGCDLYLKVIVYSMLLFFIMFSMLTVATSFVF